MLDYQKQRQLIIIVILAIILVIIAGIVALVFIWMPEEEVDIYQVGVVKSINVTQDEVIINYYNQISQLFLDSNTDEIYSLVGQDYLEFNKLDKEGIIKYLEEKQIMGRALELVTTSSYTIADYSNVYYLDIKAVNEIYSIGVVIREISPNNYTIAFDKFIDYKQNLYRNTVSSVELNINSRVRYTNSVQYHYKLTNNYHKDIVINNNSLASCILLVNNAGAVKRPLMTTMSTTQIKLSSNGARAFVAAFNINDANDYVSYNTLVLKDVLYDGMEGISDIQYSLGY